MILTNRWRDFCISFFAYGIGMGLCVGIVNRNALIGLLAGVIGGALFSLLMLVANLVSSRVFVKLRDSINEHRRVVCDGSAVVRGVHGWLYLTEKTLEFHPGKSNWFHEDLNIPIAVLQEARIDKNKITIRAADTLSFDFLVAKSPLWKEQIDKAIGCFDASAVASPSAEN